MKNAVLSAAALTFSTASAEGTDFAKLITDRLVDYAGLNEETPVVDLAANDESETPRVMAFGYETRSMSSNGLVGYELGLNMDIGWSYELPLYNEDEYLVFRQRGSLFAGGRQFVSFTFYAARLYIFLDLWVAKATLENYLRYDIVNYGSFCNAAQYLIDLARASLLF